MRSGLGVILTAAILLLAACASRPPILPQLMPAKTSVIELSDTPFFPQANFQCGPAALATVLHGAGIAVEPESLVDQVYLPDKKGSLQVEMQAATRRAGRIPYVIDPNLDALWAELNAGRPVLVLQNLGLKRLAVWHYAVVIGMDPARDQVILRSGVERRLLSNAAAFLRSWQLSGNWAMVVLMPGEMPAAPEQQRYVAAVALAEPMLPVKERIRAYLSAIERWPASTTAHFGYAHALYGAGKLAAAESAYRKLLMRNPRHAAAYNNLAEVLVDRGCIEQAHVAANRALDIATVDQPALVEPIKETLRDIPSSSASQHQCHP